MINTLTTDSLMKVASALPEMFNSMSADSLIEYSQTTQVEPLVLVDVGIQNQDFASEVLVTLTNVFSAYYLQAVALSNTIGSVTVLKRLSKFSPNRNLKDAAAMRLSGISMDAFSRELPSFKDVEPPYHHASLEAQYSSPKKKSGDGKEKTGEGKEKTGGNVRAANADALSNVKNIDSLATGKMLQVEIIDESKTVTIPVQVKLTPVGIAPDIFVSCFSEGGFKNNTKERFWRMKADELSAIADLIFCNDLIKEHKSNLKKDTSGIYAEVSKRRRNNKVAALLTGTPSVASASNIAVISSSTALEWERELGGSLDGFSQREKIFSASSLMIVVVIDTEWERATIYYRGIAKGSELGLRDLKTVNKNSGPDVLEMIRAFTASPKTGTGPLI